MRWAAQLLAAGILAAGCGVPSVGDCKVQCTAAGGCPEGLTCESEGYCRAAGADQTCAALLDGGVDDGIDAGDPGPDAGPCTDPAACPLSFGLPSPVLEIHRGVTAHDNPHLTPDLRRLYFIDAATLLVAARPDTDSPFAAPAEVAGQDLPQYQVQSASLTGDELVLAVTARLDNEDPQLYLASRGVAGDGFGPLS